MTTTTMPCPSQVPCPGTVTVTTNDQGTVMRCDTCIFHMVTSNRGQLDLGIVRDPMLDARNDVAVFHEEFTGVTAHFDLPTGDGRITFGDPVPPTLCPRCGCWLTRLMRDDGACPLCGEPTP